MVLFLYSPYVLVEMRSNCSIYAGPEPLVRKKKSTEIVILL